MDGSPRCDTERSAGPRGRRRRSSALLAALTLCSRVLVLQAASLHFSKEPRSQDALHGRSAILRCELGEPAGAVRYWWTQDGQRVQDSQRRFQDGSNLKFTAVDRHADTGNFQCVVSSGAQSLTSANASFNIKWLERGPVTMNEPASEAELEEAERIVLQCHIDGHPRPSSKWFRDGAPLDRKDRILTLVNLSLEDSGKYSCCARNAAGQVCSDHNITLSVVDKSVPRVLLAPVDQVVLRDEDAVFHCQFRAKPPPLLLWLHDGEPVHNTSRVVVYDNGTLQISQVQQQRSTGVYRCVAQYGEDRQVYVEASLRIAEIEEMGARLHRVFPADSMQQVRCEPPRGQPEPQVWWERAGARVASEGRVHQRDIELIFTRTHTSDSGLYVCVARNTAGQKQQELLVTVATSPEWIVQPEDTYIEEGQQGFLHCHAEGTPEPQVTWYRRGVPITEEASGYKLFSNGTLRINSAELSDGVQYSCRTETAGGALTAQARVHILERLKFAPVPQASQCLQLHRESRVSCVAKGREPLTVHWSRADGAVLPPHVSQADDGVLLFSSVRLSDGGNYTCVASSSSQGQIRAHVHLTVAVHVEFSVEPEQTTVYQGHTAVLHCQASGDPQPQLQWMIRDTLLTGSSSSRFQQMANGSLVISDVSSEDSGVYTCIAGNTCSIRDAPAQLFVVEKPAPRDEDEDKSQFKLFQTVALSVAVAVAYMMAMLGLMFYCKQRRRSRHTQKTHSAAEAETECLNGGAVPLNGHRVAGLQEEVALTDLRASADPEKEQSCSDTHQFPRAHLQHITTLGRGVFGEVFLAKARALLASEEQTLVLVKSLQSSEVCAQREFSREMQMFSKLQHTHITRLLGVCTETQPLYMMLEYEDLGDLKQFLQIQSSSSSSTHPISTRTKISICAQVADGMQYLSQQGFVHGDVAARNCLISGQRHVKVSALGLSQDVYKSEYYQHGQLWIPLRWLPLECVLHREFSSKSDVWAFAVLMWEVFSLADLPYTHLSDEQVLEGLRGGVLRLPPPAGCPAPLFSLMCRCCSSSPKERPAFSEILQTLTDAHTHPKV